MTICSISAPTIPEEGNRYLANQAELTYYSNESGELVGQSKYTDRYEKIGAYYLPLERNKEEFAKGKASLATLMLQNVMYEK